MRIAVLVHNDVVRDARVRKEAETLVRAGHEVDVFGLSRGGRYPDEIHGARLALVELIELRPRAVQLRHAFVAAALIVFAGAALAGLLFLTPIAGLFETPLIPLFALAVALALLYVAGAARWAVARLRRLVQNGWFVRLRYNRMAAALAAAASHRRYDAVHAHDIIALVAGARLKRQGSAPRLVWDAHELYEEIEYPDPTTADLMAKLIDEATPDVDCFITISDSFRDIYAERHRLPRAHVVMNATRFDPSPDAYDGRLHDAAGLDRTRRILLFQGGLSKGRGIPALLDAAADMPRGWSLVFMGWGALQPDVERARDAIGGGRIALIPPALQSELRAWTAGATLGAIPYENTSLNHLYCTPNKLWEYPNAGVPILATDLVEMGRMVREWGTGELLPRDFTSDDILTAINGLDDQALDAMRRACHRFSEQMSWLRFEPSLLAAYDGLT